MSERKRTAAQRRASASRAKKGAGASSSDDEVAAYSSDPSDAASPAARKEPRAKRARHDAGSDDEPEGVDILDDAGPADVPDLGESELVPGTNLRRGSIVAIRMKNFITYSG
jgi:hypothetical protein